VPSGIDHSVFSLGVLKNLVIICSKPLLWAFQALYFDKEFMNLLAGSPNRGGCLELDS